MTRACLTLLIGAAVLGVPASAHHSFPAHYLEDQSVSIEGDLVQFEYRNPHTWVHVSAKDETGTMKQVSAEWASAARLKQWGIGEDALKPGDRLIITGSPSRNPTEYRMHLKTIQRRADGWQWSAPARR